MARGVHGEKIVSAIASDKMPETDIPRLEEALRRYDIWVEQLKNADGECLENLIENMVQYLNEYKFYIDINLIFDSEEDFLYRQKGQLKLDNTVIEEFMPLFVKKCIEKIQGSCNIEVSSQISTFSSVYFASSLSSPNIGGGINIKTKDQDFSMSRKLYLQSSYDPGFSPEKTVKLETHRLQLFLLVQKL